MANQRTAKHTSAARILDVTHANPYAGRLYNPCCGSGGMFVQSERFVEAHGDETTDISIFRQVSNTTTWRLAPMNLAICGIDADIQCGNSFLDDRWCFHRGTKHYLDEFQRIVSGKATTMGHIKRGHLSNAKLAVSSDKMLSAVFRGTRHGLQSAHQYVEAGRHAGVAAYHAAAHTPGWRA